MELHILDPLDLDLTVKGVDVGPLLSWLQRLLAPDNIMRISVQIEDNKATIAADRDAAGGGGLWIPEVQSSNQAITDAIAYGITHRQAGRRIPEVSALSRTEFAGLTRTLYDLSELNRRIASGRSPSTEDFARSASVLKSLVEKAPNWWQLTRLTAETLANAGETEEAIDYYGQTLKALDREDATQARVARDVGEQLRMLREQLPMLPLGVDQQAGADPATRIRTLLGVVSLDMQRAVSIGIVGGTPLEGALPTSQMSVIGPDPGAPTEHGMAEYLSTMVQVVRLVAPDARFLFARTEANLAGVLEGLRRFVEHQVDIVLIGLKLDSLGSAEFVAEQLDQVASSGALVVLSAGNNGPGPVYLGGQAVMDKILVAAAVGLDGEPAHFSRWGEKVVWAPGQNIPVKLVGEGPRLRAGTGYSAALAAAVAARLLDAYPNVDNPVQLLRRNSVPAEGRTEPPVLNLQSTLQAVQ